MNYQRIVQRVVVGIIIGFIVVAGFGNAVLYLWNWLMPGIFGLRAISFGQALGLMGLSWILFGGPRSFGPSHRRRALPPEERERLKRAFNAGCQPG